jgi:hypothetical protein
VGKEGRGEGGLNWGKEGLAGSAHQKGIDGGTPA